MAGEQATTRQAYPRGRGRKVDKAPPGVRRHPSGVWAIRYTCGAGHKHREKVGPLKQDAIRAYHDRRMRAHGEPGWCPGIERREKAHATRQKEHERRQAETREAGRVTLRDYAAEHVAGLKQRGQSEWWKNVRTALTAAAAVLGERKLDEITTLDVERFRDSLLGRLSRATANRYRDALSGLYRKALKEGRVAANPVGGVRKYRENSGRDAYLTAEEEVAVLEALPAALRPHFTVAINTGLRYSEQMNLRWRDVDMLASIITVPRSKNGYSRRVPINSVVRSVLMDLAAQRPRLGDAHEPVFASRPADSSRFFPKAVQEAQEALTKAGKDASRLDGFVWHGLRHTFASRLVMAGVDLRTVQELGGWRTFGMVARYSHLAPGHLQAAVERLVPSPARVEEVSQKCPEAAAPEPAMEPAVA